MSEILFSILENLDLFRKFRVQILVNPANIEGTLNPVGNLFLLQNLFWFLSQLSDQDNCYFFFLCDHFILWKIYNSFLEELWGDSRHWFFISFSSNRFYWSSFVKSRGSAVFDVSLPMRRISEKGVYLESILLYTDFLKQN